MKQYKLGDLLEVTRGMSLSGKYFSNRGDFMRLTLGNFDYNNNCFKDDKSKNNLFYVGKIKQDFILNKGDIITPLTEQAIGLLGSTAKIPCDNKYIHSQDVGLIKCNQKLNPDFAFYLISSQLVKNQLGATAQQTKIRHTSPSKIKDCVVWIPDIDSQKKIANFLKSIDDKIAVNNTINATLENLAKAIYQYYFIQFDFPNANGKPYKSSGGEMIFNPTLNHHIPKTFEVKVMKDFLSVVTGKEDANFATKNGQYAFFTCGDEILRCDKSVFKGKAILIAGNGNFNVKYFDGEFNAYQRTYVLIPKNELYAGILYFSALNRIDIFTKGSNGSIVKFITKGDIENIPVILPNDTQILSVFNTILDKQNLIRIENQKLKALRDFLLPLLLNAQARI